MAIISLLSAFGPGTPLAGAISGHRCFANYWFARSVFATIRVGRLQTSKTVDHKLSISLGSLGQVQTVATEGLRWATLYFEATPEAGQSVFDRFAEKTAGGLPWSEPSIRSIARLALHRKLAHLSSHYA